MEQNQYLMYTLIISSSGARKLICFWFQLI